MFHPGLRRIGGGIGITPFIAGLEQLAEQAGVRFHLLVEQVDGLPRSRFHQELFHMR